MHSREIKTTLILSCNLTTGHLILVYIKHMYLFMNMSHEHKLPTYCISRELFITATSLGMDWAIWTQTSINFDIVDVFSSISIEHSLRKSALGHGK